LQNGLTDLFQGLESPISVGDALVAIGFSLLAAIVAYLMYQMFYRFLGERLRGMMLETMSVLEGRVSLYYQYRAERDFDWTGFAGELHRLAAPDKIEAFIG